MKNTISKAWKLYGVDGHRQEESFSSSYKIDLSKDDETRIYEVFNSDRTHTYMFSVSKITTNSLEDCCRELDAQISDGLFEDMEIGKVEEIALEELDELLARDCKSLD